MSNQRPIFNRKGEFVEPTFFLSNPVSMSVVADGISYQLAISNGNRFFYTVSGTIGSTAYLSFTGLLGTQLNALYTGYNFYPLYDPYRGALFIYTDPGANVQFHIKPGFSSQILGMTGVLDSSDAIAPGPPTGGLADFISGTMVPYYVWRSSYLGRSKWKKSYEPKSFWTDHVADDGTVYSFGRGSSEKLSSWRWEMEDSNHARRVESLGTSEPYSWQHVVEQVRSTYPFVVHTSSVREPTWVNKEGVYRLIGEQSNFNVENVDPNWQDYVNIPVSVRVSVMGTGSGQF